MKGWRGWGGGWDIVEGWIIAWADSDVTMMAIGEEVDEGEK